MANPRTIARISARIQERAAHCLQFEIRDPRAGFVTITRVETTNDLSLAKVYYSVLGDDGDRSRVAHMLDHATSFVQRQVTRVLKMRRAPALRFVYDDSIETAAAMDQLIREARERDRRIDPSLADREANEDRIATQEAAAREAARIVERDAALAAAREDADDDDDDEIVEESGDDDATHDATQDDATRGRARRDGATHDGSNPDGAAPRRAADPRGPTGEHRAGS
jgi:ribosome-binding factor A